MSEAERAEIIRQWYGGGSFRGIARALGMNRKTVAAVIKAHKDKRAQSHLSVPAPASQRKSLLDPRPVPKLGPFEIDHKSAA